MDRYSACWKCIISLETIGRMRLLLLSFNFLWLSFSPAVTWNSLLYFLFVLAERAFIFNAAECYCRNSGTNTKRTVPREVMFACVHLCVIHNFTCRVHMNHNVMPAYGAGLCVCMDAWVCLPHPCSALYYMKLQLTVRLDRSFQLLTNVMPSPFRNSVVIMDKFDDEVES